MSRICIYVDGESHFHRSEGHIRDTFKKSLEEVSSAPPEQKNPHARPFPPASGARFLLRRECKLFWDNLMPYWFGMLNSPSDELRAIYFTAFSGSADDLHGIRKFIREKGFEPIVLHELRTRADHRAEQISKGLIEKPKGVDIELAVRLLEDAREDVFDRCYIFTSDEDYIPIIRAVRRRGKIVKVAGYRSMIAKNSEFEFVPDSFIDLGKMPSSI